eukprot:s1293_g8.t1
MYTNRHCAPTPSRSLFVWFGGCCDAFGFMNCACPHWEEDEGDIFLDSNLYDDECFYEVRHRITFFDHTICHLHRLVELLEEQHRYAGFFGKIRRILSSSTARLAKLVCSCLLLHEGMISSPDALREMLARHLRRMPRKEPMMAKGSPSRVRSGVVRRCSKLRTLTVEVCEFVSGGLRF